MPFHSIQDCGLNVRKPKKNCEQKDTEAAKYPMAIECETLGMSDAQARVAAAGVTAVWDEATRQNYAEWDGADGKEVQDMA